MTRYLAPSALLPHGWADEVTLDVGADGRLTKIGLGSETSDQRATVRLPGPVIPGVVNGHSHAFQRALAGGAEANGGTEASFWGWRAALYELALRVTPEQMAVLARQLYTELVEAGYTRVVEFHYLHNAPSGARYDDPLEMARRLVAAAREVGLGLTLLPVLYQDGDFGGLPAGPGQRRFLTSTADFIRNLAGLASLESESPDALRIGLAFHSLRAVGPRAMTEVFQALSAPRPIHLHAAEQPKEVQGCTAWSGRRPVKWILDELPVDESWSLVHCTHMEPGEVRGLAESGATAVVCPSTEANLGDGLFPLESYLGARGSLAIGSDSHVATSPVEELRWLEYGQRLRTGRRTLAASAQYPSTARSLLETVWRGGASAAGVDVGALKPGSRADWIVLDAEHPILAGRRGDGLLDAWIFSGNRPAIREVWVGGRRVVLDGGHPRREEHARAFQATMTQLLEG